MRVDLGDLSLNVELDGREGEPWLVLSNSLGADLRMWAPQMPRLARHYRVLRYDTRGHGQSDTPPGPWDFDDLVGDVLRLMDHHGIERADYMGLSLGGMTGLGLGLAHPDRVDRIVCADARADAAPAFVEMWDARMAAIEAGGLDAIADGVVASWLTEDWREAHPEETAQVRAMVLGTDPAGYLACSAALKRLDYLRRLPEMTRPVLFIGGDADKGAPPEVMRAMAEATPRGRHAVVEGAAHVANLNRPEAFTEAVIGFLDP